MLYTLETIQAVTDDLVSTYNALGNLLDQYPRAVGQMVMVSPQTEDDIEAMINDLDDKVRVLEDDQVEVILSDEDMEQLRPILAIVKEVIEGQRCAIAASREFLSRYLAR